VRVRILYVLAESKNVESKNAENKTAGLGGEGCEGEGTLTLVLKPMLIVK
jgi:hypothetical protein